MVNRSTSLKRFLQNFGRIVLGGCLIGLPTLCRAANNCAWINEATASGLLGGEAVGEVTEPTAGQPVACTFTQHGERVKRTLRVTVEIAGNAHTRLSTIAQICGPNAVPLKAIGNEAFICAEDGGKNQMGEFVVGRVRDQVFTITIGTTLKDDSILTRDELRSRIYMAAEQISGNLF
jgi:hypothetical protein